jgi:signal transduction histidine kinase
LKVAETRRLADLSRLIVGIAHELRNPLNAVRLNLFTSEKLIRGESTVTKEDAAVMIRESVSELERVNDLIGQLLGFARVESQQENWIDIDEEIHSVDRFMKQIHQHHGIHLKVPQVSSNVRAKISAKHFKQILLNLLQNARDAMPKGGNIEISVSGQNDLVEIVVQDDGPGIDDKLYEKIFEPFYSTRQDGVGLGLAVVRNLLEVNGGSISSTRSEKLGGMKFQIHLVARFESTGLKASRPVVLANPTNFPIQDTQVMVQNEHGPIHTSR